MSTKKESSQVQTVQYDPASKLLFDKFQGGIQENLLNDMQLDARKSKTFNLSLQNAMQGNQQLKNRASQNLFGNMQASNFGQNSAFQQAQLNRMGRAGSSMDAQSINQNFMNYDLMRRQATQLAMNYHPLQTGQTTNTTEKTSGLGTWLPQTIGAGVQIGMGFLGGSVQNPFHGGSATASPMAGTSNGGGMTQMSSGNYFNSAALNGTYFNQSNPFTYGNANPFGGTH